MSQHHVRGTRDKFKVNINDKFKVGNHFSRI
jgi:hypothetical protein